MVHLQVSWSRHSAVSSCPWGERGQGRVGAAWEASLWHLSGQVLGSTNTAGRLGDAGASGGECGATHAR